MIQRWAAPVVFFCIVLGGVSWLGAQETESSVAPRPEGVAALIDQAIDQLAKHKTIQADVHQQVEMFGKSLVVTGRYLRGEQELERRLELNFDLSGPLKSVAEQRPSYVELVCDGTRLTVREAVLNYTRDITINVDQVLGELDKQQKPELRPVVIDLLGVGGIGQLLRGLRDTMDPEHWVRDQAAEASLGQQHVAGVYVLRGRWKSKLLEIYQPPRPSEDPDSAPAPTPIPPHVPTDVMLVLDEASGIPHRIDYRHIDEKSKKETTIIRLEYRNPKFDEAIDPSEFIFLSTNPIDLTDQWVNRLGFSEFLDQLQDPARNRTSPLSLMVRELRPEPQ